MPKLKALRLHNGTIYRWNRPCWHRDGVPHLRIENLVLPAGPTVIDEVANAAFFFGLMASYASEQTPVSSLMPFESAKENFLSSARDGLKAQLSWLDGKTRAVSELITQELIPRAREGRRCRHRREDIDRYLGVVKKRVGCAHRRELDG